MTTSKSFFLGLALLLATSAFAANKGSLSVQEPVTINGTQLKPGDYKVQWDGTGDQVELRIYQGKNVVASTSARLVTVEHPFPSDAVLVTTNGDGSMSLSRITFGGKKYALEIAGEAGASGAAGAAR